MRDLAIHLENRPGALAEMGEAMGSAGVRIEAARLSSTAKALRIKGREVSENWKKQNQ